MKNKAWLLSMIILFSACAGGKDPLLAKYESYAAETDQRAARGEISQMDADNLKMQAYQDYQEIRRREERQMMNDLVSQQTRAQNQELNAVLRQARQT